MFSFFWGCAWIWFAFNVIINITLAQVEHGFLEQKEISGQEWLTKPIQDPGIEDELEGLTKNSLTIPDAIKNMKKQKFEDYLELDEFAKNLRKITSKK